MTAATRARGALDDLRVVLVPWLTARALLVAGYLVAVAGSDRLVPGNKPTALTEGLIAWDGTWYRDIALHGENALTLGIEPLRAFLRRGKIDVRDDDACALFHEPLRRSSPKPARGADENPELLLRDMHLGSEIGGQRAKPPCETNRQRLQDRFLHPLAHPANPLA